MKYYIDVKEVFIKTIAVEADDIIQAEQRARTAYKLGEFDIERDNPDDVEFTDATSTIIEMGLDAEDIEEFECHEVVFDEDEDAWVCPVCGNYLADDAYAQELDADLPKFCRKCGTNVCF